MTTGRINQGARVTILVCQTSGAPLSRGRPARSRSPGSGRSLSLVFSWRDGALCRGEAGDYRVQPPRRGSAVAENASSVSANRRLYCPAPTRRARTNVFRNCRRASLVSGESWRLYGPAPRRRQRADFSILHELSLLCGRSDRSPGRVTRPRLCFGTYSSEANARPADGGSKKFSKGATVDHARD